MKWFYDTCDKVEDWINEDVFKALIVTIALGTAAIAIISLVVFLVITLHLVPLIVYLAGLAMLLVGYLLIAFAIGIVAQAIVHAIRGRF